MGREMKALVVGDMHCKEEFILTRVDTAVELLGCERVVFCGDYVDEWHSSILTMRDATDALRSWVLARRADGLMVDLVMGNHDMQYRLHEAGPGTHTALFSEVAHLLDELGVRAAVTVGNSLVTHAGVTRAWANDCLDLTEGTDAATIARQLNALLDHGQKVSLRMLAMAGEGRGGWELPGPLWADQSELSQDPLPGLDQIVGHTPVESVDLWNIPADDGVHTTARLIFCDTMSLRGDLSPIGDGSMLLVDGKTIRAVTDDELGMQPWQSAVWDWMTTSVLPFLG